MAEIAVTRELVQGLAKAARLNLSEEETEKYAQQLSVILDAFKELDEVPTEGVEPSYHPIEIADRLREDEPVKWIWEPLANVKDAEAGYIRGPKIK
ncbi:Asp-tRNA(Asn)/Glu-tRNA(Gln) amidotransferase subunit GatC [Candidatus Bathyarchaeota archaeon]|nr:Asp-tRNA(Asn)/Glu-tRNA(Gln) amidotransferase subunit GatC [Candidatus Bathyarchaeota archaeon]